MDGLLNILVQVVQLVLNALIGILNMFFSLVETLLPSSPFASISSYISDIPWLGVLNYFVPIASILEILLLWAGAMIVYFIVAVILRWIKVVK